MFFIKSSQSKDIFLVLCFFSKIVSLGNNFTANFFTTAFCFLVRTGNTLVTRFRAFPSDALDPNAGIVAQGVNIVGASYVSLTFFLESLLCSALFFLFSSYSVFFLIHPIYSSNAQHWVSFYSRKKRNIFNVSGNNLSKKNTKMQSKSF